LDLSWLICSDVISNARIRPSKSCANILKPKEERKKKKKKETVLRPTKAREKEEGAHSCVHQCFSLVDEELDFIKQATLQLDFVTLALCLMLGIEAHLERPLRLVDQ